MNEIKSKGNWTMHRLTLKILTEKKIMKLDRIYKFDNRKRNHSKETESNKTKKN